MHWDENNPSNNSLREFSKCLCIAASHVRSLRNHFIFINLTYHILVDWKQTHTLLTYVSSAYLLHGNHAEYYCRAIVWNHSRLFIYTIHHYAEAGKLRNAYSPTRKMVGIDRWGKCTEYQQAHSNWLWHFEFYLM